ncbi:carboxypeptidase regulatory-like domain-containing protein, partial [bacterium]|nr:carboxypeptidase regulatory-like domain-containing protein [bacterium]
MGAPPIPSQPASTGPSKGTIWYEDFEDEWPSGPFPPAGWGNHILGDTLNNWFPNGGTGAIAIDSLCYLHIDDDVTTGCDDWLVTDTITVPTSKAFLVLLDFQQFGAYPSYYIYHGVWASTGSNDPNDGQFSEVMEIGPGTHGAWTASPTVDLTAYAGQKIFLAFVYQGDYADWWGIDNIDVHTETNAPMTLDHDPRGDTDDTTPTITATVIDADGVDTVMVWYDTGAKAFVSLPMTLTGVLADEYSADLPIGGLGTVDYYIEAIDDLGVGMTTDISAFDICVFEGYEQAYDDGTVENAYTWGGEVRWAVRFSPLVYPCTLTTAEAGIFHGWPDDPHDKLVFEIYDDDGAGGFPGSLLYGPDSTGSIGNVIGDPAPFKYNLHWATCCLKEEVIITEGDFYVSVATNLFGSEGIECDVNTPNTRSYVFDPNTLTWVFDPVEYDLSFVIRCRYFPIPAMGDLDGTVSEAKGPIEGAVVTVTGPKAEFVDITDINGYYLFEDLIEGNYDIHVCYPGYYPDSFFDVFVAGGATTTQNSALVPCADDCMLCEGFEGPFPPCYWAVYQLDASSHDWQQSSPAHTDSWAAWVIYDYTFTNDTWLVTPQLSIPSGHTALLDFYQYGQYQSYYGYHGIWVSEGSGVPATDFVELEETGPATNDTWTYYSANLDAYAGKDIYVAFRYTGFDADNWAIDDVGVCSTPVSVELASFTANAGDRAVSLNWETRSEVNNLGFQIYRSVEDAEFELIDAEMIPGAGNSEDAHSYTYVDRGLSNDVTYYYKIATVDFGGNVDMSDMVVSATPTQVLPTTFALSQNYPNP